MASNITFYWGSGSPYCWRVQIVLEEKGLSGYNSKLLSFEKKEHKSDEVMALNPRGQVPVLKIGDTVINESLAAMMYLNCEYNGQGNSLMPKEAKAKAMAMQRLFEIQNLNDKFYNEYAKYLRMTKPEDRDKDTLAEKKKNLLEELDVWEKYIKATPFIGGQEFTMADAMFFPVVAFLVRLQANISGRYPGLKAYHDKLQERPSIKASWPPHWKGTEGPPMLKDLL